MTIDLSRFDKISPSVASGAARTITGTAALSTSDRIIHADATGLPAPSALAATAVADGGTFSQAQMVYYKVTAVASDGTTSYESCGSNEAAVPVVKNGSVTLTWAEPTLPTGWTLTSYKLYRSVMPGLESVASAAAGGPSLLASDLTSAAATDTGTATTTGGVPATNGGAFTITAPRAENFTSLLLVKATTTGMNLVTLVPQSGQTINKKASITLGSSSSGADYRSVLVSSDGSNLHVISAEKPLPAPTIGRPQNTVVLFGDSITGLNQGPFQTGASGQVTSLSRKWTGWFEWAQEALNQRFTVLHNAGVQGDTTTKMLARISQDVLAYQPAYVILHAGVNDIQQYQTLAAIQANFQAIIARLTAAGIRVILLTTLTSGNGATQLNPAAWQASHSYAAGVAYTHSGTTYLTTAQYTSDGTYGATDTANTVVITSPLQVMHQLQRWLAQYGANTPGVYPIEWHTQYQNVSTGYTDSALSGDLTHPNTVGSAKLGAYLASKLSSIVPACDHLPVSNADTDNLAINPMITGTDGTVPAGTSGTVAHGLIPANNNSVDTVVCSQVARTDGITGNWQKFVVPALTNFQVQFVKIDTPTALLGLPIFAEAEYTVESNANAPDFRIYLRCLSAGYGGLGDVVSAASSFWNESSPRENSSTYQPSAGVMRTPDLIVPAATGHIYAYILADCRANVLGNPAITFSLGRNGLYLSSSV